MTSTSYGPNADQEPGNGKRSKELDGDRSILVAAVASDALLAELTVARAMGVYLRARVHLISLVNPLASAEQALQTLGVEQAQARDLVFESAAGAPVESLLRLARERRSILIVLGTSAGSTGADTRLSPMIQELLRRAPCWVLLVRPELNLSGWAIRRILLPHDGTPAMAGAFGPAAEIARRAHAELSVLHVATAGAGPKAEPGTLSGPQYVDQPQHEWPVWSREFLARLQTRGQHPAEIELRLSLAMGEPSLAIVQRARDDTSDLIVLTWRGRLDDDHAATLKQVLATAPCPVLVVRGAPGSTLDSDTGVDLRTSR